MTIKEIFDRMEYGPAPEGNAEAKAWLAKHGASFGHFIDGAFTRPVQTFPTKNPANGTDLAAITQGTAQDIDTAVNAARRAQPKWARLPGHARAKYLYALARLIHEGIGTKPDPVKAWALATLAAERGEKEADALVKEIAVKLDEKQRAEALKELENIKSGKTGKMDEAPKAADPKAPN